MVEQDLDNPFFENFGLVKVDNNLIEGHLDFVEVENKNCLVVEVENRYLALVGHYMS
jgi:hypothetical protein